jgi:FKBP-type peptidyl-prolyl cis-trans isomerase FkpA
MIKKIFPIALLGAALISNTGCKHESELKKLKGMEYKIVRETKGKKAAIGDIVEFNIIATLDTTGGTHVDTLGDSRKMPPPNHPINRVDSDRTGDFKSVFSRMAVGDSAIVYISCDTLIKSVPPGQRVPPFFKPGGKITVYLSLISDKTYEQYTADMKSKQEEMQKKAQEDAAKQLPIDDKLLQDYFAKNNLKPTKTESGLYYSVSKQGAGDSPKPGQMVTMNYTGKTLDGKTFDSNMDTAFHRKQPFIFPAGQGRVIKGWDEGVMLLKKGSKATFYIPSPLAYGTRDQSPTLPPNSILIFDVEVTDIKDAPQQRQMPMPQQGQQGQGQGQ